MSAKLVGEKEVRRWLKRLRGNADNALLELADDWATSVQQDARFRVRKQTRLLHNSIEQRIDDSALTAEVGVWNPTAMEYAEVTEHGNSRQSAFPYLLPAALGAEAHVEAWLKKAVEVHLR